MERYLLSVDLSKCQSTDKWTNNITYYFRHNHLPMKKNKILVHAVTWIEIMLSGKSQSWNTVISWKLTEHISP